MYGVTNVVMFVACVGGVAVWHPSNIRNILPALPLWVVLLWGCICEAFVCLSLLGLLVVKVSG